MHDLHDWYKQASAVATPAGNNKNVLDQATHAISCVATSSNDLQRLLESKEVGIKYATSDAIAMVAAKYLYHSSESETPTNSEQLKRAVGILTGGYSSPPDVLAAFQEVTHQQVPNRDTLLPARAKNLSKHADIFKCTGNVPAQMCKYLNPNTRVIAFPHGGDKYYMTQTGTVYYLISYWLFAYGSTYL